MLEPRQSLDMVRLWVYCISGVVTVIILMIMICYLAFRQECADRAARRRATALNYTRIQQWEQHVHSFPDLAHRPASDVLASLGISHHQTCSQLHPV